MDLSVIEEALTKITDRILFDEWILENEINLANFFYKNSGQSFNDLGFHDFYFGTFLSSSVYQDYHSKKTLTDSFTFFLNLISSASEKLALYGNAAPALSIISDLPDSAVKFRLEAINLFASVDDIRTSYIINFPIILEWLDKSRVNFEEGNLRTILDVLIGFYKKAKTSLESKSLTSVIVQLKLLFKEESLIDLYPFLDNQIIEDLIDDKEIFAISINEFDRDCFTPSPIIAELFREINSDYFNHPKINHSADNLWGYSKKYILDNILGRGRGDYTINSGLITAADKVILYCFYNLKKHFFTAYGVFEIVVDSLGDFFNKEEYTPTFIDLGCGPMTSGLALGDLIKSKTGNAINFTYVGIDISKAMLYKAKEFEKLSIFSNDCQFYYYTDWGKLGFKILYDKGVNHPIILNASYLFASDSLDPENLAEFVKMISSNFNNVYFVFQNSTLLERNLKYERFKSYLEIKPIISSSEILRYKAATYETDEHVYYEILKL